MCVVYGVTTHAVNQMGPISAGRPGGLYPPPPSITASADPPRVSPVERSDKCRLDVGSCRQRLNEAQREVDRLRRGMLDRVELRMMPCPAHGECRDVSASKRDGPTTTMPEPRRLYAVPAIGEVELAARETPPPAHPPIVLHGPRVTNLGSVIDVMA